MSHSSKVTQVN